MSGGVRKQDLRGSCFPTERRHNAEDELFVSERRLLAQRRFRQLECRVNAARAVLKVRLVPVLDRHRLDRLRQSLIDHHRDRLRLDFFFHGFSFGEGLEKRMKDEG